MHTAYILDAVRTVRGRGRADKGAISSVHPQELVAQVLHAISKRSPGIEEHVDDVILGCVSQVGEQGSNLARNAVLAAGWPEHVGGVTLNRFCGSGLQAVSFGAMGVASGAQPLVVAGGVESMSRVPMGSDGGAVDGKNIRLRNKVFQVPQGISADLIATIEGFSRADVDGWALRSQKRAAVAIAEGRFSKSMIPVVDPESGKVLLAHDEHPRADTSIEGLTKLGAAFVDMGAAAVGNNGETLDQLATLRYPDVKAINHVHSAGNSSGIVDGAAAVVLASEAYVKANGAKPRAKIRGVATIGSEPVIMLTAPAPASMKALALAGMSVKDVDLWEINEAFAAVVLQTIRKLDLDADRVNVNGGAIALGHPLGATGAMLLGTVLDELERTDKATAVVTLCIGGGQGIAVVIERLR